MNEPVCLTNDLPLLTGIEMPKHISKLPSWVLNLFGLEVLILNCCGQLESLPIEVLLKFPFLRSLDVAGCGKLFSPPQEICSQGGEVTMRFLREVQKSGKFNDIMNLFLLGDGEAGKTSVVMALKSNANRAAHIRADHRTVGIDISSWKADNHINFRIYDLAGQLVYAKTHQHFLLKRALYLFIWRALSGSRDLSTLVASVKYWLDSLQNRMPGSYVMVVVTHIDQVDSATLQSQSHLVQGTVCDWLNHRSDSTAHLLRVWNRGESIPVDCISGQGVSLLRASVLSVASGMPWCREALPVEWIELQGHLEKSRVRRSFISFSRYSVLAAKCGITGRMLSMATTFMHESGVIQYFGGFGQSDSVNLSDLLQSVVFISIPWMIDVMKGLLCHDRQALIDFFSSNQDREMLLRLNNFIKYGRLHKDLLPFLWPSRNQCKEFWEFLCKKNKRDREIWSRHAVLSSDDLACAVAVLVGFDQVADDGNELLVPGALMAARFPSIPALDVGECPYRVQFHYSALPPGAFDSIVIRIAKDGSRCAQITSFLAVFYETAGDICQIFWFRDDGNTDTEILVLRSSSKRFLDKAEQVVLRMEKQFSGLRRQHRAEHHQGNLLAVSNNFLWKGERRFSLSPDIVCVNCMRSHRRDAHVFDKSAYSKMWQQIFFDGSNIEDILCPGCNFQHNAVRLLTTWRISDAERRQCPCCPQFGNTSSSFFSTGECRQQLSLSTARETATVTCFDCMHNGRIGQICILDLVQEEVFVSGLRTLNKDLLDSVSKTIKQIEIEADVGCCWSLNRLKECLVVVLLLSDANINDKNFIEEFRSVVRSRRSIIPFLLPHTGSCTNKGLSLGWTGSAGGEYWTHAVQTGSSDEYVDWSFLRHFSPLQYPLALCSGTPLKQDFVEFSKLATAEINTRIQRDGKLSTYAEISSLGVRLSYFDAFIEMFGGVESFQELTTEEVMHRFVKPFTANTRQSLCELLLSQGLDIHVGNAEWFLSHAWVYHFLDVVSSLKSRFKGNGADPVIWFDLFSVSQHKAQSRPFEWWNTAFLSAIGNIGQVLMLVQPFDDVSTGIPAWITLVRAWCVFEVYACEATFGLFEVIMTKNMSARFLEDLDANPASVLSMLEGFDCAKCVASTMEDQVRIFEVIDRTVGFSLLNTTVMRVVERWLYGILFMNRKSDALNIMEHICSRCLEIRCQRIGSDHPDTANSRRILLLIQRAQTDAEFLEVLVKKGWVAYELEEFQQAEHVKTVEEDLMLKQRANEIAKLEAEEDAEEEEKHTKEIEEQRAREEQRVKEELNKKQQDVQGAEEKGRNKADIELDRARAQQAASDQQVSQQSAQKFKCCSIA